jgi:SWI/SNF-related matrix-associated actin-dependent regulator 1 of chromatin subfamily A
MKADVLKDLPPKRYKLVVFPENGETRKVLQREAEFDAAELIAHGAPVGSALPEIRREMGVAKVPQAAEYISDLLEGGAQKVIVFGHHIEVIGELERKLRRFGVAVITGSTPQKARQAAVDAFQTDPRVRVFLGNEAAEEGITLTAAADVVLAEPEWVPGKNEQRVDRAHRIGQKDRVIVHILVVEGSLDAKILGAAANKMKDIKGILGG